MTTKIEKKPINGKAIYAPKGAAMEYGRIGCNFYTGCPHECEYCYLKRGAPSKQLGGTEVRLKKCFKNELDAERQFVKELTKWYDQCKQYGIFLSFTTDPMIDETRKLTMRVIDDAIITDVPVYILTKNANFIYDNYFMALMSYITHPYRALIHFGFTLTGRDDMEPKASKNHDRIMAMRRMSLMGFPTFASIEPVIDWESAERIIGESLPWCDHYKLGLRSGVKKDYYDVVLSSVAIQRIVQTIESFKKTIYLKESTRKLLQQFLQPNAYESLLSHTVDMDGKPIVNTRNK